MTHASRTSPLPLLPIDLHQAYNPQAVEASIYDFWQKNRLFKPESQLPPGGSEHFSIVIPPPNVTGVLHMGHALDCTLQDILIRWHRMRGTPTLWMPGADHAGIATQSVVERNLKKEGKTRYDLGREKFLGTVWDWANARKEDINNQFRRLGISPDWDRWRFTLDEGCSQAVREAFVRLYQKNLIYRGEYIVNWCPVTRSAISDIETEYSEEDSFLWHIRYPVVKNGQETDQAITVATTRPETMYGDVAVAVHPNDARYKALVGKHVRLPLTGKDIPIIADDYVEPDFGTGAVKITPAHDPNDFHVGRRHNLEPIVIMDEAASIKALDFIPSEVRSLDRFEAREVTKNLLEAGGYLVAEEPHRLRVGRAQRSGAIVEPLLSKQWFVKTKPLAEAALKALEKGEIRFIPERWTQDYLRWMTNIQDWCISRQLWWGHQIPAWHCVDCGEITVGLEPPTQCAHCPSKNLTQDADVLDTWFSSGLWPFSTMGWPHTDAPDYRAFYPTSVLVTGFDIIFFWVARMTMLGHEMTGQSPFHTVYIHGLIRDEKGQKMSKSKGNTVDPVETINQYGCDAFRYGLTSLVTYGGQDIKLSLERFEQGKLFCNKLWNASRFVMMNLGLLDRRCEEEQHDDVATSLVEAIDPAQLSRMDRWILSRTHRTVAEANRLLEDYRFGELAQLLLDFTWNQFCDWYVEYAKTQMKDPAKTDNTQRILFHVLDTILRLFHPIMPTITEALWQALWKALAHRPTLSLMLVPYPQADPAWLDADAVDTHHTLNSVDFTLSVVRAIRHLRQSYHVPPATQVSVIVESPQADERQALAEGEDILRHFVKLSHWQVVETLTEQSPEQTSQSAASVVGRSRVLLSLEGLIDVAAEKERLHKKAETLRKEQAQLFQMMSNADFLEKAPPAVVAKNKTRLDELVQQLRLLDEQLSGLG